MKSITISQQTPQNSIYSTNYSRIRPNSTDYAHA